MSARIPSSVQGTYIGAIAGASLIFCCAAYSGAGAAMQVVAQMQLGGSGLAGGDPMLARMMEMQRTMAIVSLALVSVQLLSAVALVVGGALGLGGRPAGRSITLAAFALVALVVLAEIGAAIWSFSELRATFASVAPGTEMSAEEARIATIAGAAGAIPTACWVFFKLALVAIGSGVLLSAEARAFYETIGPAGLRPGPREV